MTENRKTLNTSDFDGFDKRKLPSPGFQVEVVMVDYNGTLPTRSEADSTSKQSDGTSNAGVTAKSNRSKVTRSEDNDDVFSDSEGEETSASKSREASSGAQSAANSHASNTTAEKIGNLTHKTDQLSLGSEEPTQGNAYKEITSDGTGKPASGLETPNLVSSGASDFKAMAADASVFTFGDDEDFESD
nr:phosphatidylinositol 3,4,5-trisphosphate 3-phosphatase and protein-tyrosine-phosphatase PTEN2A-like [Quercus suber]